MQSTELVLMLVLLLLFESVTWQLHSCPLSIAAGVDIASWLIGWLCG